MKKLFVLFIFMSAYVAVFAQDNDENDNKYRRHVAISLNLGPSFVITKPSFVSTIEGNFGNTMNQNLSNFALAIQVDILFKGSNAIVPFFSGLSCGIKSEDKTDSWYTHLDQTSTNIGGMFRHYFGKRIFCPYVHAGIGFSMNSYDLTAWKSTSRPYSYTSKDLSYTSAGVLIPVGAGLRVFFGKHFGLSLETNYNTELNITEIKNTQGSETFSGDKGTYSALSVTGGLVLAF